jgi:hypothetical protein
VRGAHTGLLALVLSGALATAGCGGSKTAATTAAAAANLALLSAPPAVPLRSQRAINRHAGIYAYVPGRAPLGYRYDGWQREKAGAKGLLIWFKEKKQPPDFTFDAGAETNNCPGGKTLWLHGGKVYWSGNNENDQYMWVCVTGSKHGVVQLTVDAAPSTRGGPSVTTLAAVLHSAHRIGGTSLRPVPQWLGAAETRTLATDFGQARPIRTDYISYPLKIAVIWQFNHVVVCNVCGGPSNATIPGGRVIRVSFGRLTHRLGNAMQFCESRGSSPARALCLRR